MNRYRFAFAILAICATVTLLSVPVITTTEARTILPAKVVLFKSTTEAPRISAVATGAFLDNLSAGAMAVIAAYPLLQVDVYYGQTLLRAYTGSAAIGDGEDLTEEIAAGDDRTFASDTGWWSKSVAQVTIADGVCHFAAAANGSMLYRSAGNIAPTCLYKTIFTVANRTGGAAYVRLGGVGGATGSHRTTNDTFTQYLTVSATPTNTSLGFGCYDQSTFDIDNVSVSQVTGPSTSGCLLYNSRALSTQSVAVNTFAKGSYNQSAYTLILSKPR